MLMLTRDEFDDKIVSIGEEKRRMVIRLINKPKADFLYHHYQNCTDENKEKVHEIMEADSYLKGKEQM